MLREVVHQDVSKQRILGVSKEDERRISSCNQVGEYRDQNDDSVVFLHIVVRDPETFQNVHDSLYRFVKAHMAGWLIEERITCWVIYEQPDLQEWRMQIVKRELTHVHQNGKYRKLVEHTGMRDSRIESSDATSITLLVETLLLYTQRPLVEELIRGVQTLSKPLAELVQGDTDSIHATLDMQQRRLDALEQTRPFAERIVVNDAQQALNEAAIQFEIAAAQLVALLYEQEEMLGGITVQSLADKDGVLVGLADVWEHSRPRRCRFEEQDHVVRTWQQVYHHVLLYLYERHGESFVETMNRTKRPESKPFFAQDGSIYKSMRMLGTSSQWCYDTWMSAQSVNMNIRKVYEVMGLSATTFQVWIDKKH